MTHVKIVQLTEEELKELLEKEMTKVVEQTVALMLPHMKDKASERNQYNLLITQTQAAEILGVNIKTFKKNYKLSMNRASEGLTDKYYYNDVTALAARVAKQN